MTTFQYILHHIQTSRLYIFCTISSYEKLQRGKKTKGRGRIKQQYMELKVGECTQYELVKFTRVWPKSWIVISWVFGAILMEHNQDFLLDRHKLKDKVTFGDSIKCLAAEINEVCTSSNITLRDCKRRTMQQKYENRTIRKTSMAPACHENQIRNKYFT